MTADEVELVRECRRLVDGTPAVLMFWVRARGKPITSVSVRIGSPFDPHHQYAEIMADGADPAEALSAFRRAWDRGVCTYSHQPWRPKRFPVYAG